MCNDKDALTALRERLRGKEGFVRVLEEAPEIFEVFVKIRRKHTPALILQGGVDSPEDIQAAHALLDGYERRDLPPRPKVVCLCGSGRFRAEFIEAEFEETIAGKIVLTIGCNTKDVARDRSLDHHKPNLDVLHLRKIDLADEVLILNVDGYIGESTALELRYAQKQGKIIRFLEPEGRVPKEGSDDCDS